MASSPIKKSENFSPLTNGGENDLEHELNDPNLDKVGLKGAEDQPRYAGDGLKRANDHDKKESLLEGGIKGGIKGGSSK